MRNETESKQNQNQNIAHSFDQSLYLCQPQGWFWSAVLLLLFQEVGGRS